MKLSSIVALGLVAGAAAGQVHLKANTAEELSGSFKAEDGTVMHFRSTPGKLQLADADMQEIWDSEAMPESPELMEGKEVTEMVNRMQGSAELKNAHEFSAALGETHMGHENPLALQFHAQMLGFAQGQDIEVDSKFAEEEEEDAEMVEEEAQWGRRRRRRRRWWRRKYGECGRGGMQTRHNCRSRTPRDSNIGMCGPGSKCLKFVCGDCGCHKKCRTHDHECCNGNGGWCQAKAFTVMTDCSCC